MKAGVLIVGLGRIGLSYDLALDPTRFVHSHTRAFQQHPRFGLLAGVDRDEARRQAFSTATGAPAYASLEPALAQHAPELVVIATPTEDHAGQVASVLQRSRPKAILCEKPLAMEPESARAMVEACEAAGVALFVNYFRRSLPGVIEVRRRLDAGLIAADGKAVSWYSKGFLHNGSHFFNLLEYWLGPAQDASCFGPARLGPAGIEIDCHVRFEKGAAVLLAAWEEAYSHFDLELLTRNGRLRYGSDGAMNWQPAATMQSGGMLSPAAEAIDSGQDRYQWHVAQQLASWLDGRPAELCSGRQALRTLESMQVVLAAKQGA